MDIKKDYQDILNNLDGVDYAGLNVLADFVNLIDIHIGCMQNSSITTTSCTICANFPVCKVVRDLSIRLNGKICDIEEAMFKD